MAQAPYEGYSTAQPEAPPAPPIRLNVPGAAFGENIGAAIQGFGGNLEKAGNEVYSRAVALQELHNQNEARDLFTKYADQQGTAHEQYSTTQGKNAVDGFDPYKATSKDLLTTLAGSASSLDVRTKFLNEASPFYTRNINAAAGHAATENRKYTDGSINSVIDQKIDLVRQNPTDKALYQQTWNDLNGMFYTKQGVWGWSDPERDDNLAKMRSLMTAARIDGLSRTDSIGSRIEMQDAIKDGRLRGEDINKTYDQVKKEVYTQGTRAVIRDVQNADGHDISYGQRILPPDLAAKTISSMEQDNRGYDTYVDSKTVHGHALGKYGIMEDNLPGWLRMAGLQDMTPQAFLKDHDAQEKVFATVFGAMQTKWGNFNDAASEWLTGKGLNDPTNVAQDRFGTNATKYVAKANAYLAANAPVSEQIEKVRQKAGAIAGDDPFMSEFVQGAINGYDQEASRAAQLRRIESYEHAEVVNSYIVGSRSPDGKAPNGWEEALKLPGFAETISGYDYTEQQHFKKLVNDNAKSEFKQSEVLEVARLDSMRQLDPEGFLEEVKNITDNKQLDNANKRRYINEARDVRKGQEGDPYVARAVSQLERSGLFDDLGIDKTQDKERYHQFTGLLMDALADQRRENKGMPATMDQVDKIGKRLAAGYAPGFFKSDPAFFEKPMTLTPTEVEKRRDDYMAQNPGEPLLTDEEIARDWIRDEYEKTYKTGKPKPGKPQGGNL